MTKKKALLWCCCFHPTHMSVKQFYELEGFTLVHVINEQKHPERQVASLEGTLLEHCT